MNKSKVAASILNANFLNLKSQLDQLIVAGINTIHFDVMDGQFVNNISFGPEVLKSITNNYSNLFIDCHMMVEINNKTIDEYLQPYVVAKANSITLHYEALKNHQWEQFITFSNKNELEIGLAINPETPVSKIEKYLKDINRILVMSVNPGFGGQKFLENTFVKIEQLKKLKNKYNFNIIVDGGINKTTGLNCLAAGADSLVIGSYLLNSSDIKKTLAEFI